MRMLLPVVLLAACADMQIGYQSSLEPGRDPGTFRWKTVADTIYPVESEAAERARMGQLRKVMDSACPSGFVVENRQATKRMDAAISSGIWDVYYDVRCS